MIGQTLKPADGESIASILLELERHPGREVTIDTGPRPRALRNPVAMRLLQRKAEDLGLAVSVISQDEMTRQLCAEAGFACYPDTRSLTRKGAVRSPRPRAGAGWLSGAAGLCLLALVLFLGWFVLPAASITITPAAAGVAVDVPVTVDASASAVDLAAGKIPGRVLAQEVSGQATVA
ncbi:MAG TPA: hypothetical protein VF157_15415, partial [Chloroflexota bacterium]